jgi:hypothetical protein
MNQTVSPSPTDAQIDIQARQVVLRFPSGPAVHFSLDIPDLRCAGYSPTYTYKAWMWCAYINALQAAHIQLGYELNQELFQKIWVRVEETLMERFAVKQRALTVDRNA